MIILGWILLFILTFLKIVPIGVLFIWGIFSTLYCLCVIIKSGSQLSNIGRVNLVLGILTSIALGLKIFMDYDILKIILRQ